MPGEDPKYLVWVRGNECARSGHGECLGAMHAHHIRPRHSAHDHKTIALCAKHHTERHGASGAFKGWTKARFKEWELSEATRYRQQYLGLGLEDSF